MTSGGGLTTLETARRFPIRLVESGPAGGAILASFVAAECAENKVLSFDMGGTTAKICLIENLKPAGLAQLRGRPRRALPEGQRPALAHPRDRDGGDRRRRRLARPCRCHGPHHRRARERRRRAGAGLLRPRRQPSDGDRCRSHARPHRSGALRRGTAAARRHQGRGGAARPTSAHRSRSRPCSRAMAWPRSSTRTWPMRRASIRWSGARSSPSTA